MSSLTATCDRLPVVKDAETVGSTLPIAMKSKFDSFGAATYLGGGCGGLYKFKNPDLMEPIPSLAGKRDATFNFAFFPLQWQTYGRRVSSAER